MNACAGADVYEHAMHVHTHSHLHVHVLPGLRPGQLIADSSNLDEGDHPFVKKLARFLIRTNGRPTQELAGSLSHAGEQCDCPLGDLGTIPRTGRG